MPFKNPENKKNWQKDYYHKNGLKEVQTDRARLNYWRKRYCKLTLTKIEDFKKCAERMSLDEEQLRYLCAQYT